MTPQARLAKLEATIKPPEKPSRLTKALIDKIVESILSEPDFAEVESPKERLDAFNDRFNQIWIEAGIMPVRDESEEPTLSGCRTVETAL